jgi:dTDP-4-amino-4,6-dideoxygalactose transaminase
MRLDIGWGDLAFALTSCARSGGSAPARARRVEKLWSDTGGALACLSVRTGLDLFLRARGLPAGSEVLTSALTILDMARILERHGLVPVPVDVDLATIAPDLEALRALCTSRTRAVLVAHLFGGRVPMDPVVRFAREHDLLVLEDCAQAFAADGWTGHPEADLTMFSFGTIKTATALGGALLCVRDAETLDRMRRLHADDPLQRRSSFLSRVLRAYILKTLTQPRIFGAFLRLLLLTRLDLDSDLHGAVRGFPGHDLLAAIRHRPSAPLLGLIERRLRTYSPERVAARVAAARRAARLLPRGARIPGSAASPHAFWVFPLLAREPGRLVSRLRAAGFDATRHSSMVVVGGEAPRARQVLEQSVFVPIAPDLSEREIERLAGALTLESPEPAPAASFAP